MGGQKSGTPWRPPLQMCTSSFMSAVIASSSAPLKHPYPFQQLSNIAYCQTTAIVPSGMVERTCFQASSHSTRGEGGAQFLPLGGGGGGASAAVGGGPSMESYISHSGEGVATTHSASVFMTCSSKGLHLQTGRGGARALCPHCSSCAAAGGASTPSCCTPRGPLLCSALL